MRLNAVCFTSVLFAGLWTTACSSTAEKVTTPTSSAPGDAVGSVRPPAPVPPVAPPGSGTCNAAGAQSAVGQRASNELLEAARLAAQASTARFIRPNQPITTEFLGSRLNLQLNDQDVVRAVSCG